MAETVLKIILEGAQQVDAGLTSVTKAYSEVGNAAKKSGEQTSTAFKTTAQEGQKLNTVLQNGIPKIDFKKPAQSIQDLKKQVREFTSEAIKAGEGTKEFARLMGEAGKRKADIKDLQQAIAALDPDTKAKAFLQLSQTIVSGFAAGTGALAAFGISTEDAQKTLVKLQSAMAFGQFLGQVGELGDTFKILKIQIENSAAAQKAFNFITNQNPLVLLATAALAAYAAFQLLDGGIEDNTNEFIKNNEVIKDAIKERDRLRDTLAGLAIDLAKEQGLLSDTDATVLKLIEEQNNKKLELGRKFGEESKKIDESYSADLKKAKIDQDNEEIDRITSQKDKEKAARRASLQSEFNVFKQATDAKIQIAQKAEDNANKKKTDEDNKRAIEEAKKKKDRDAKIIRDGLDFIKRENEKADDEIFKSDENLNKKKEDLEKTGTEKTIENIIKVTDAQKAANEEFEKNNKEAYERAIKRLEDQQQLASQFGDALGLLLAGHVENNEKLLQQATKQILLLTIDTIEKSVLANVVAANATATVGSLASPQSILTGGVAGIAQSAVLVGLITAAFSAFKALLTNAIGFHDGGFTGQGGEWEPAGVVHKGEFVTTKEKTDKHRGLLEAIHNDKAPSIADITGLLKGTGVVLLPEVAGRVSSEMTASSNQKLYQQQMSDKNLEELNKNFKKWMDKQGENFDKTLPDGTRVIKTGNTIRTIRKRRI